MNKYRGKSFDPLFPPSRDPEIVEGTFDGGISLERSAQDIALNLSPAHDRVRVERGALRQDYGQFELGEPAPSRILALGEHRFVRVGFVLFEKTFRLYRDGNGFPVIESWNGTAWVFEVTTAEFTIANVLLSWKSYFNAVYFADGEKVFKWDNSNSLELLGNDFPAQNVLDSVGDVVEATVVEAGAFQDKFTVYYSLRLNGPTFGAGSVTVQVTIETDPGQGPIQVVVGQRIHQFVPSNDVDNEVLIENASIEFEFDLNPGDKVKLSILDVTLAPVLRTNALAAEGGDPASDTWLGNKTPAGVSSTGSYNISFNLDDFEDQGGTAFVQFHIRRVGQLGFNLIDTQELSPGRQVYELFEVEDIAEFKLIIDPVTPGEWRFANNDSHSKGAVFVEWLQLATFEVHGFNKVDDGDANYGVEYQVEGDVKNELVLVRDSGETGEVIVGRYLGIFADRVVVLISDGDQQKMRWPVRGDPTDWLGDGSGEVIIPSNSDPVDTLQALEPITSDTAILFRKRSKMRIVQTGQLEPALAPFPWIEKIGTESPFSVIPVPDGIMYLGSNKQVYFLTEGGEVQVGERIREEFLYNLNSLEEVEAVYKPDQQDYILCMAYGDETLPSIHIIERVFVGETIELNTSEVLFSGFVFFSDVHSCTPVGDAQQSTNLRLIDFEFCDDPECGGPGGWRATWTNAP